MTSQRDECTLCRLVVTPSVEMPLLASNDAAILVLSDDWAVRGHAMIVAREHVENTSDLSERDFSRFFELLRHAERVLLDKLRVERIILMKLGIAVPHLHLHLYPFDRAAGREQVLAAINGESAVEPEQEERAEFVAMLRERFEDAASKGGRRESPSRK